MGSVNKIILVGYLGADPETKSFEGGKTLSKFNVATTDKWTDSTSGDTKERTEWHRVVAWGKLAEAAAKYLSKGRQVYVEGRVQTHKWTDSEQKTCYMTEVIANSVEFLGGGSKTELADAA